MRKKERYERLIAYFQEAMPVAETELHYSNPYELLVAVMLSAQCTDKRVNIVCKELFAKYPSFEEMAEANVEEVEEIVKPCGTGSPSPAISARLAPLPPSSSRMFALPSVCPAPKK